jgi:ABC-type sugar transport system ATPase subunit
MDHPQARAAERTRVEVIDCAKTYSGGAQVLHPTTLTVEPGEVLALLGPSGCGKTTLLRVIAGLVDPDRGGRIVFNGDDVTARPIEQRAVGMVFQHYALFPQMTVEANIGYGRSSSWCAWAGWSSGGRRSSPAASGSVWRWLVQWRSSRACCCWTNRSLRWTPS